MIKEILTSLALVVGCTIAVAVPAAQAQTSMNSPRYNHLPNTNSEFREWRILKECGSITIAHLRTGCIDTVNIEEDQRALGLNEGLTGGGSGMMDPMSPHPYNPNMPIPDAGR